MIFDNLSFTIVTGEVNILLGRNGEGKTTLLDVISGLLKTGAAIQEPVNQNDILYMIQGVPMLSTIRGKDLARLILVPAGHYHYSQISAQFLENALEMDPSSLEKINYLWETQYGKMAPGERRWFITLLNCMVDKKMYLFDEPTAGIDSASALQIIRRINHLNDNGKTILYVTHRIEELNQFSDFQLHLLRHGKIVYSASKMKWINQCEGNSGHFHIPGRQ